MTALDLRGDVGSELDDPAHASRPVEHGIVRSLDPDRATILGHALELAGLRLAAPRRFPECPVGRCIALGRRHKRAVVAPLQLGEGIAEEFEKDRIGGEDGAVGGELGAGARAVDRVHQVTQVGIEQAHGRSPRSQRSYCFSFRYGSAQLSLCYVKDGITETSYNWRVKSQFKFRQNNIGLVPAERVASEPRSSAPGSGIALGGFQALQGPGTLLLELRRGQLARIDTARELHAEGDRLLLLRRQHHARACRRPSPLRPFCVRDPARIPIGPEPTEVLLQDHRLPRFGSGSLAGAQGGCERDGGDTMIHGRSPQVLS